jgi:hypothetical protein
MSAEKRALQWLSGVPLALCLVLAFVAVFSAFWWLGKVGSATRPASAHPVGTAPPGTAGAVVGTMARLQPLPGQSLWLARDGRAYELYWRAQAARDARGAQALVDTGAVFIADDDTEARVTAVGRGCFRVRVLEGEHQGQEGWVPASCLHALEGQRDF